MRELLSNGLSPAGALWRYLEVQAVREQIRRYGIRRPVLELGCGDGVITKLTLGYVEIAIDIEPAAVLRARAAGDVYGSVRLLDARKLTDAEAYETVFANSVLEHISGVDEVLEGCYRALNPGGQLITTVPLASMNDNLLFRSARYVETRRRQLVHHNLWAVDEWHSQLVAAGFTDVRKSYYLHGKLCRLWDSLDAPTYIGLGRYRLSAILRRKTRIPGSIRARVDARLASWLLRETVRSGWVGDPCACLLVATK